MKKPPYISHYLVLKDLINKVDVRRFNDSIVYLVSRIENIKLWLKSRGIKFVENATSSSRFATYKPYILIDSEGNMKRAKELLEELETPEILTFIALWRAEEKVNKIVPKQP